MEIYLDNAATTAQKPPAVFEAMQKILSSNQYGNPSRGAHAFSLRAWQVIDHAKMLVKKLFCADDDYAVAFTANSTTALNFTLKGLLKPGDHVIATAWEHNAVLRPLYQLAKNDIAASFLPAQEKTGTLCYEQLESLLKKNTRLLVCNLASNVTGNVVELEKIKSFCQKHGLIFVADASQAAGCCPLSLADGAIDALCFTGHKSLYGPGGTGGVCLKKSLRLEPLITGGDGNFSFSHEQPASLPLVLEAGTANVAGAAGLAAGIGYILQKTPAAIFAKEQSLLQRLELGIKNVPGIITYGEAAPKRLGVLSLNFSGIDSADVSDILWNDYQIATRSGYHCAPLMHEALGTKATGCVRFSLSDFTMEEEIDAAIFALHEIGKKL